MKIFISTSAAFYDKVAPFIEQLQKLGHTVVPPNGYGEAADENVIRESKDHQAWKEKMLRKDIELVSSCDAVLVLNFEKNNQANYVGASAFLELYIAFEYNKKRFILNPLPTGVFYDELVGINPVVLNGDLSQVR